MNRISGILLLCCCVFVSLTAQGQNSLYKRFEKSKDVETYYMRNYKEYAGCKLDATLIRYEKGDRIRCRQIFSQIMNTTTGLTPYFQGKTEELVVSYWYTKGKVLIINYNINKGKIDCMVLEGALTKQQAKSFLASLPSPKSLQSSEKTLVNPNKSPAIQHQSLLAEAGSNEDAQ